METVDGTVTEETYDWYPQDDHENVCYFREDTKAYLCDDRTHPDCIETVGSWEAGVDKALPGYIMLAEPRPRTRRIRPRF